MVQRSKSRRSRLPQNRFTFNPKPMVGVIMPKRLSLEKKSELAQKVKIPEIQTVEEEKCKKSK